MGWSADIRIDTDLAEPVVPPEDWHVVSDPERVMTGMASDDPGRAESRAVLDCLDARS